LQRIQPAEPGREPAPPGGSPAEEALVAKFVRAYQSSDVDALVALLTDDVFIAMPPIPFQYEGRDAAVRFFAAILGQHRYDFVPTRANGQPAFGVYLHTPTGMRRGAELLVLTLSGDRICALTSFENSMLPSFGLPPSLPSAKPDSKRLFSQ
jgi:hypothetical protein